MKKGEGAVGGEGTKWEGEGVGLGEVTVTVIEVKGGGREEQGNER